MKSIAIFSFFFFGWLCLATLGTAQSNNSLLFKVEMKGTNKVSYLFGTFHIMCKDDFTISSRLSEAITSCKQFYGELDMSNPNLQQELMGKLAWDKTLQSNFSDSTFNLLNQKFQAITKLPLLALNSFKPFMSMSMLMLNAAECAYKVQPENELLKIAQANNAYIDGLETVEDQMKALQYQTEQEQCKQLQAAIQNFDSVRIAYKNMAAVYKLNDADSIYNFLLQTEQDNSFENEMLIKRNQKWIPTMIKTIATANTFFAVGAGHLGGEHGVISLLRKQGFSVTPIDY